MFWTIPIANDSVESERDGARLKVKRLGVPDYFNLQNALAEGPSVPAEVSFDCRWRHPLGTETIRNADSDQMFAGTFTRTLTTVNWSGREAGFEFQSSPGTEQTVWAEIGRERNGAFFA